MTQENWKWLAIATLSIAVFLSIGVMAQQSTQLASLQGRLKAMEMKLTEPTTAITDSPAGSNPVIAKESGREAFGPLTSPDGKWVMVDEVVASYTMLPNFEKVESSWVDRETTLTHRLVIKSLDGKEEKEIFSTKEYRKQNEGCSAFSTITNKSMPTAWKSVGWSADSKKIYYLSGPCSCINDNAACKKPDYGKYSQLHEVDLAQKTNVVIFNAEGELVTIDEPMTGIKYHFIDIDTLHQQMILGASALENYFTTLGSIKGLNQTDLSFTGVGSDESLDFHSAVISPSGKRVAIVESGPQYTEQDSVYVATLFIYDVATKKRTASSGFANVALGSSSCIPKWINESTLSFESCGVPALKESIKIE